MTRKITLPEIQPDVTRTNLSGQRDSIPSVGRFPERLCFPRVVAGLTLVIGLVFCWLSHRPLWHTDVWGHLAYGRVIVNSGGIPETEPLMPLSTGVPFVDTAWLSQVVGYAVIESFGNPAIQFMYAAGITICLSLLVWRLFKQTGNALLCFMGGVLFLWVNWQQLSIVRPQLAGLICFVLLLTMLLEGKWHRGYWIALPILFALWANLHGSFPVGLAVLGCLCAGRFADVLLQTKRFSTALGDLLFRRTLLAGLLCAVAVLLNPYGFRIYHEVLAVTSHPNLTNLVEWGPLHPGMKQGLAAGVVGVMLLILYWFSPRRISVVEVLLLVGLGAGCLWASRMLIWWAPVAAYYFVIHGDVLWKSLSHGRKSYNPSSSSGTWTVLTAGLVWVYFAASPLGMSLLYGPHKSSASGKALSALTPVGAVEYLKNTAPGGLVFNTYEWGDFLLWAGPEDIQVFVASHAHLLPEDVWRDYLRIIDVTSDCSELLDRYGVETVVIDHFGRGLLIEELQRDAGWRIAYDDGLAVVFVRRTSF